MHAIAYIATCLIFGTTFIAIKTGLQAGGLPLQLAGLRFVLAGVLILGFFVLVRRRRVAGLRARDVVTTSLLTTAIPFAALFMGSPYITAGEAALLVASSAAFISVLSPSDRLQKAGVALAIAGMLALFGPDVLNGTTSTAAWLAKLGILASEALYAYGAVRLGRLLAAGASIPLMNGLQMVVAGLCLLAMSLVIEGAHWPPMTLTYGLSLLHLAVLGSVVGTGLAYWLIRVQGPFLPSTSMFVSALVAALAGQWLLHEAITAATLVGAGLIALGMVGIHWRALCGLWAARRQGPSAPAPRAAG